MPPAVEYIEPSGAASMTVSDELEHWLGGDQPKTLGNIVELFGPRSFALIFVLLMALPALPRASRLFEHRVTRSVFGALVFGLTLSAFLAPPFSGLDTLPSLGVVVIGLGVLLRDLVLALLGVLLGAIGVATILAIGNLVLETAKRLL